VKRHTRSSRELMLLFGTVSMCRHIPLVYPFFETTARPRRPGFRGCSFELRFSLFDVLIMVVYGLDG
jgi:hypothetical protein